MPDPTKRSGQLARTIDAQLQSLGLASLVSNGVSIRLARIIA